LESDGAVNDLLLSAISGILLVLAFPRFGVYPLAYVAAVPLLLAVRRSRTILDSAKCGMLCGAIFFGGVLFWINTLSRWAGPWAYVSWISLAVFQALFLAAFAGSAKYISKYKLDIILIPFLWAVIEWIRSLGPFGVTGGGLGYSQAGFIPVLQLASIAGIYGISFLAVMVNEAVLEFVADRNIRVLTAALLILIMVIGFGQLRISAFRDTGREINIAVIQGNIPQDEKMDFRSMYRIVDDQEILSWKALPSRPDIIIWPETAVTTYLFDSAVIRPQIAEMVKKGRAYYLIGTPYREGDKTYNSVAALSKNGDYMGRYDKQRLVPFGEYLPLRPLFYPILRNISLFEKDYDSGKVPKIIDLGIAKVGAVICFESTFPYMVRDKIRKGAQFILVATNDAWFFDSAAPYQHIEAAQVRAAENGVYVVQAANTGVSAIIDPLGRVVKRSNVGQTAVLTGKIFVH
jgi:apolipoprotein N-acyltransferase